MREGVPARMVAPLREVPALLQGLPVLELAEWREQFGVVAGVSRAGRNFTLEGPEDPAAWRTLLRALGPAWIGLVVSHQVHGDRVLTHRSSSGVNVLSEADGHVTSTRGLALAVTVADCVPIYLLHPPTATVGLLHAGWRGTASGVLERGLDVMCEQGPGTMRELVMHCGVAICGACYEVGPEVFAALHGEPAQRGRLDLRGELARRAVDAGVGHVSVSPWCTAHDSALYSHRASGGAAGRLAAFLGSPTA